MDFNWELSSYDEREIKIPPTRRWKLPRGIEVGVFPLTVCRSSLSPLPRRSIPVDFSAHLRSKVHFRTSKRD